MAPPPFSDPYLFTTPHGSVFRCPCCGDYEVRFRGAVASVNRLELGELYETVEAARDAADAPFGWQLRARTARQTTTLALRNDDVAELADLLGGAVAMLALDALLTETLGLHLTATI